MRWGRLYLLVGSLSGTRCRLPIFRRNLPLNPDPWFSASAFATNAIYPANLGSLDGQGQATVSFVMPSGFPGFAGTTVHHAYVVLNGGAVTCIEGPSSVFVY